jgi:hypothetical protein
LAPRYTTAVPGEIGARVALPSGSFRVSSVVSCSIVTVNDISPAAARSIRPIPLPMTSASAPIPPRMLLPAPDIDLPLLRLSVAGPMPALADG